MLIPVHTLPSTDPVLSFWSILVHPSLPHSPLLPFLLYSCPSFFLLSLFPAPFFSPSFLSYLPSPLPSFLPFSSLLFFRPVPSFLSPHWRILFRTLSSLILFLTYKRYVLDASTVVGPVNLFVAEAERLIPDQLFSPRL